MPPSNLSEWKLYVLKGMLSDVSASGELSIYEGALPSDIYAGSYTIDDIKLELKEEYLALAAFRKTISNKIKELKRDA